ncbi:uncharacterized protein FYW61_016590 [Anableps anableps]
MCFRISQEGDRISCSSEGIYPQPELTWSTIPPSSITLDESTSIQQTEDQLYSISSSLMVSDGGSGLSYSCTVRTRSNRKRATFKQLPSVTMTTPETTLPCLALKTSLMKLVWRFNHELILNQTGTKLSVSEGWRKHVKQVSEHGNLTLQGLSPGLEGAYSCEVSDEDETTTTQIVLKREEKSSITFWWVIGIIMFTAVFSLLLCFCWKRRKDAEVSCAFRKRCMLPCQFQYDYDPLIHWYKVSAGDPVVHSYYTGRDQLRYQDQNFKSRTSVFQDQISRGNASLLLKGVKIIDEGRYRCYTSTLQCLQSESLRKETGSAAAQRGSTLNLSSPGPPSLHPAPLWRPEPQSSRLKTSFTASAAL